MKRCKHHPRYKAVHMPSCQCPHCWDAYYKNHPTVPRRLRRGDLVLYAGSGRIVTSTVQETAEYVYIRLNAETRAVRRNKLTWYCAREYVMYWWNYL